MQAILNRSHTTPTRLESLAGGALLARCQLRYDDLRLDRKPHGAIRWPAATDKQGEESVVPVSSAVRTAIDRVLAGRPGLGRAYLFPSPDAPERPMSKDRARLWLRNAEKLAGLPHIEWGGFPRFPSKWATERKHLPTVDVTATGGRTGTETLVRCYQQADEATILAVVLGGMHRSLKKVSPYTDLNSVHCARNNVSRAKYL
jgi:hypothetical protein